MDDRAAAVRGVSSLSTRRILGWALTCLVVVLVAGAPIPAFVVTPGPVYPLAGRITVDGQPASDWVEGDYLFTTIALEDARTYDLVLSWFGAEDVVPRTRYLPADGDEQEFIDQQRSLFRAATAAAAEAAASAAGLSTLDVVVSADDVGGPSAGLLIALAAFDVASPVDVAAGRRIGGTGEVEADGDVLAVGSVAMKVAGAAGDGVAVFLVPTGQVEQAMAALPAGSSMRVIGVDTVGEAIDELTTSVGSRPD